MKKQLPLKSHLIVTVKIVKAFEDTTQPTNPHPIDIHHASIAQVVDVGSYPPSISKLLEQ